MSDTILSGNFTVYYKAENRRQQFRWTGTTAKDDTEMMIDVYDELEDLMTLPAQMDDGLVLSAETPGEFTVGKIDAGEVDPWFVDMKTMEHIVGDYENFTGCALKTSGWTRVVGTNTGIVVVAVTAASNNIVAADIGLDITHADGDAGTLLDVIVTGGTNDYLWIRPDSSAAANNFDSTSLNLTCNAHTAPQSAAAVTGEMVWGNVYTQGALVTDTHVYILQDDTKVTSVDETDQDWWVDGHIQRAIPITDYTTAAFPIIDEGYLTVKANQYGSKYTYAIIRMNTTSGGNVSAGVSSGADITNTTGYASVTLSGATGTFTEGDEIEGATSGARAILTLVENAGATPTLHFYYVGDPLEAFSISETIANNDDTGTGSENGSGVADQGPALAGWFDGSVVPTYTFANAQADVTDDGTDEEYAITIDLNQCALSQMHEYNKYLHMRGSAIDQDGVDGEQWIGIDYAIFYSAFTITIAEGDVATGATSGATGTVVSFPGGTNNVMLLRDTRGTFLDTEIINFTSGGNMSAAQVTSVEAIVPVAANSFGTLAGTTFFASRGVLLTDYKSSEENNFSLIDANGTPAARPTSISITVSNAKQYDYITGFRLTASGGDVNKTEYTCTGGEAIGDTTIDTTAIAADVPGKSLGGTLVLVDTSDNGKEYVIRFSSYDATTGTVTLANVDIAALTSGDVDTLTNTGSFSTTKVGDLVYNHDLDEVSYVSVVTSNDSVELNPPFSADPTGDHIELNCIPVITTASDYIYFSIVWEFKESDGSASASMQYVADFYALIRARNTSSAAIKIKGFTAETLIGTSGGSASVTRIENTVYGS